MSCVVEVSEVTSRGYLHFHKVVFEEVLEAEEYYGRGVSLEVEDGFRSLGVSKSMVRGSLPIHAVVFPEVVSTKVEVVKLIRVDQTVRSSKTFRFSQILCI